MHSQAEFALRSAPEAAARSAFEVAALLCSRDTHSEAGAQDERKGRKGRETAERILDAAERVFAEKGFEGATLRDVARAARLRTPSLYNHFDSKDALYAAVLERGIGPLLAALLESAREGTGTDPDRLVRELMVLLAQRPELPRLVLAETLHGGKHLTRMLQEWIGPMFARAQRMVEEGPAASRWEPEQLPNLVLAMYHIVVGYFAIAPFYQDLNDVDLLSEAALARQTRFLRKLATSLFGA